MSRNALLPTKKVVEFEKIYSLFDANGDGCLTRQEVVDALELLGQGISPSDRTNLLNRVLDGVVPHDSFIQWMAQRQDLDVSSDLRQIFQLIDVDNSGRLSFEEFTQIVRCFYTDASDAEIDALVKKADLDGDGQIDFEEFIATQAEGSELKITVAALRSFKKILMQYAKVAEVSSIALVEVDSDLGAGKRGASKGINFLKEAAVEKQTARMRAENGVVSLDNRAVQNENHALAQSQVYPHAKYIDAIYKVLARTTDIVNQTLQDGLFPVVLGGDHSTAAGTIAGIKKAFPERRLGVVWIDAHADIHSPYTTPSGNMHGMPLGAASGYDNHSNSINNLDPETAKLWEMCKSLGIAEGANLSLQDLIYVSVRDTEAAEEAVIAQHNIPILTTQEVRELGPEASAQRCLTYLAQCDIIYVTFDVDSMDSTICMGTGTPVPGGLWADEARRLNAALVKDPRVCCWEICEINPLLDTLNTLAENSLSIFEAVIDVISSRLQAAT
ncbi:MAG: arginase [Symploca sp. SIO2D2]|nr:arginase [Symploca sp. SIO2D2]